MKKPKFKVTSLIVLTVFCLFAVCTMIVVLVGAQIYENMADRGRAQFEKRTVARYITTRVRQSDVAEGLRVEEFCGRNALAFREQIGGNDYKTFVYCYEGYIRELFAAEEGSFLPEDGEKILKAHEVKFEAEGNFLKVYITLEDRTEQELVLYLRSGETEDGL